MLAILHQSYWRDEAFSVLLASKNLKEIIALTIKDIHPPLYYLLLNIWIRLFGDAEHITRSLSLLFYTLLVITSFFLLKYLLRNWKPALLGTMAIAFNPFLIEYAFEVRSYMFFALVVVLSALFYMKKRYFMFSVFLALSLLTHNFAIFFFLAFVAFWLFENSKQFSGKILRLIRTFGIPSLIFLGWLKVLWNQWVKVAEGFWIEPKTSSIFVESFRAFFQGSLGYPSKAMLYNITLALAVLAFSYLIFSKARSEKAIVFNRKIKLLIFLTAIPFFAVYLISSLWVPIYHERFLIPILPLLVALGSYLLNKLYRQDKQLSYIIFSLAVAYILFALQSTEQIINTSTKPPINYGVSQIVAKAKTGDVIIPESNLNFLEVKYYVAKSDKQIPVLAYSQDGKIVFYIGSVLFEEREIITKYPTDKRIWTISPDGSHYIKTETSID